MHTKTKTDVNLSKSDTLGVEEHDTQRWPTT